MMNLILGLLVWLSPLIYFALFADGCRWAMRNAPDAEDIGHD